MFLPAMFAPAEMAPKGRTSQPSFAPEAQEESEFLALLRAELKLFAPKEEANDVEAPTEREGPLEEEVDDPNLLLVALPRRLLKALMRRVQMPAPEELLPPFLEELLVLEEVVEVESPRGSLVAVLHTGSYIPE